MEETSGGLRFSFVLHAGSALRSNQVAQGFIHLDLEDLQGWRLHNPSGQLPAMLESSSLLMCREEMLWGCNSSFVEKPLNSSQCSVCAASPFPPERPGGASPRGHGWVPLSPQSVLLKSCEHRVRGKVTSPVLLTRLLLLPYLFAFLFPHWAAE